MSLGRLLGLESPSESSPGVQRTGHDRLLVVRRDGVRVVLPADEVSGVQRFHSSELKDVPTTVGKAASAHSRAVLSWSGHVVGLLDDHLLFRTLHRSVG
jgi:chemotaxis-related protein WspD